MDFLDYRDLLFTDNHLFIIDYVRTGVEGRHLLQIAANELAVN